MKTNKLIAGFMAVSVVVAQFGAIVPTLSVNADNEENKMAYEFAYDNGLTSMTSLAAFNFDGTTTREAAARFLVKGAEALGFELSSDQSCKYKDLATADQSLVEFINTGCEMGILKAQDNFNPKGTFTRAQAELTVARIVFGMDEVAAHSEENNISEYAAAREMLMDYDIITVAVNPDSAVKRGHLLLMLYRLADMDMVDNGNGTGTGTVATGTDDVVKAGNLDVSLNATSPANGSSVPQNGTSRFASVDFSAGSKDVTLNSVSFLRKGLGTTSDIYRVYFEKNGVRITGKAAISSDDKVTVSFAPALVIKAGSTETLDLVADMNGVSGSEHQFVSTVVNASAQTINGVITTPVLRTANYAVSALRFIPSVSSNSYQLDGKSVELGRFDLTLSGSTTRSTTVKSIVLTNSGRVELSQLSNIVLERNGTVVSKTVSVSGRTLTISLVDDILDTQSKGTYVLKGIIDTVERETDSVNLYLKNVTDINAVEKVTGFRVASEASAMVLGNYIVRGSDTKFATNSGFVTTVRAPQGASSVVLMDGTIYSKSDITLEDIKLNISSTSTGASLIAKKLTLTIGNATFTHTTQNSTAYTGEFNGSVVVSAGQTLKVKLIADTIESNAPANATLKVGNFTNGSSKIEYVSNNDSVSILGSVQGATLTVNPTNLQVSNSLSSSQTIVLNAPNSVVLAPKFTTSYDNSVRVNQFEVAISTGLVGTTWYLKDANGATLANATANAGKVVFSNINLIVSKNAPVSTTVVLDNVPNTNVTGSTVLTIQNIDAVDTSTWNTITSNQVTKTLTIAAKATVTAATATNTTRLAYAGEPSLPIGTVTLKAANSDATITRLDIDMNGTNIANFDAYKLNALTLKEGSTILSSASIINSGTNFSFDGLTYVIPAGQSKTFVVYASIPQLNTVAELNNTTFGLTLNGGRFTSATVETPIIGGQIMSSNIKVLKTKLTVSNPVKAQGGSTPSMSFVLTPSNGNTVTVGSGAWKFLVSANNVSGAATIVVSSESNGGGTIYATGAYGSTSALTAVNDLSVSQATTVYVTVKTISNWNAANASTAGNIVASLSDFSYSDSVSDGDVVYNSIYASYTNDLGSNISTTLTQ